jgi:2-polyprenyl-6-methoxyphenol hydroxylase-like FAD-dependent oxidoreductase
VTVAQIRTPVLIVGGGPVGLALAGDLAWHNVSSLLLERGAGTVDQPKMDLVGVRTMEFCRRWGLVEAVENSPYPRDYPQDYVWVTALTGYELGREPFPAKDDEAPPVQSPQKRERCPQDMFDPILQKWVRTMPLAQLRYGCEVLEISETEGGVRAVALDLETGEVLEVLADYAVGCDGAASKVRAALGQTLDGIPALTYTTNVIFRSEDLDSLHDKGPAYRYIFIGPGGTEATLVAINGADRWRFSIVGTPERQDLSDDEVTRAIVQAVGRDFDFEVLSVVTWARREMVAKTFGRGRMFVAGDAAHLMSPTGGFGMNTGIGDAVDLAWKLAACHQGWGGEHLLKSYEAERRPVAVRNVTEASGNLGRMLSARSSLPPAMVFQPGAEGDAARLEFGSWYTAMMRPEWFTIGIHLGYRYDPSPICVDDGSPAPVDEVMTYEQTARPGSRAPHVWLADGSSTLDLFGRTFVLLRIAADTETNRTEVGDLIRAAAAAGMPLRLVDVDDPNVAAAYGKALVLVRPDGHVAWRADHVPSDPGAIVDTIRGAGSPTNAPAAIGSHRSVGSNA